MYLSSLTELVALFILPAEHAYSVTFTMSIPSRFVTGYIRVLAAILSYYLTRYFFLFFIDRVKPMLDGTNIGSADR